MSLVSQKLPSVCLSLCPLSNSDLSGCVSSAKLSSVCWLSKSVLSGCVSSAKLSSVCSSLLSNSDLNGCVSSAKIIFSLFESVVKFRS